MIRDLIKGKCQIVDIIDNRFNKSYTNYREAYIGSVGNAVLGESMHECPGAIILYFVDSKSVYLESSPGTLILEAEDGICKIYKLITKNSTYKFIMSDIQEIQSSSFDKDEKTMKMTINEALETIKGERWIACQEKYHEAMDLIKDTINKYQKIEEILDNWKSDGGAFEMSEPYYLGLIDEVVKDEKNDN